MNHEVWRRARTEFWITVAFTFVNSAIMAIAYKLLLKRGQIALDSVLLWIMFFFWPLIFTVGKPKVSRWMVVIQFLLAVSIFLVVKSFRG